MAKLILTENAVKRALRRINESNYDNDIRTDNQEKEEMSVLKETIKGMIRESINNMMGFQQFPSEGGDMMEKHTQKSKHSPHNQHYKTNPKTNRTKRAIVIHWLKDPKNAVNCAEIMRQLWNPSPEEEDTKRGEFYKKRDGAINKDSGARYSFTDEEINALYRIKSHHE